MSYEILALAPSFSGWKKWYGRKVFLKESEIPAPEMYVGDDYAEKEDYGSYMKDDELAYRHALAMMKAISCKKKEEHARARCFIYYKKLYKDLKNYLYVSEMIDEGTREQAELLIRYLATNQLKVELAGIVRAYWEDYCEGDGAYPLDFEELYLACGDKMLFERRDIASAIRFYELAALDWTIDDETGRAPKIEWEMPGLADCRAVGEEQKLPPEKTEKGEEERACRLAYEKFLRYRERIPENYGALLESANEFAGAYTAFTDVLADAEDAVKGGKAAIRCCYALAVQMKRMSLLYALYFLADEKTEMQKTFRDAALKELRETTQENLWPVRKYLASYRDGNQAPYTELLQLAKCVGLAELISALLLAADTEQELAYYTSIDTLRYLLPERAGDACGRLSVMHMAYMNDPNEGKTLHRFVRGTDEEGGAGRKSVEYPYVFMKCFTSLIDDLPMWEMYGNHAQGCCVILEKDSFVGGEHPKTVPLYRVCYLTKSQGGYRLTEEANRDIGDLKMLGGYLEKLQKIYGKLQCCSGARQTCFRILDKITFLFKDADYQHEQELRILYSYSGISEDFRHTKEEFPKLYVQPEFGIEIKELILGPKVEDIAGKMPYLQEQLEKMCDETGTWMPEITVSAIQYR